MGDKASSDPTSDQSSSKSCSRSSSCSSTTRSPSAPFRLKNESQRRQEQLKADDFFKQVHEWRSEARQSCTSESAGASCSAGRASSEEEWSKHEKQKKEK